MTARIPWAVITCGAFASAPGLATAQAPAAFSVAVSTDSVEMGELFEMRVSVPVPPNSIVYFPDTLPATVNMESASPVRVGATATAEGAELQLTYEMMAFGVGPLPVPGLDVLMTARGGQDGAMQLPAGSVTGAWTDAPGPSGARVVRIPRQAVWVAPVFTPGDLFTGVDPMPPNDVSGGNWSWPALTLLLLCSSLLALSLVSTAKGVLERAGIRAPNPPPTPDELRRRALEELDALLAEGHHREGRSLDFYTGGSDIVRRYVEGLGSGRTSLTSTELMQRLQAGSGVRASGDLADQMRLAEVVKFGRLRPDAVSAEKHWGILRSWIAGSGGRA